MPQEKPQGEFATLWKEALAADTELEQVELNAALADIMSTKDATEQVTAVLARVAQPGPSPSPNPNPNPYPNPSPALSRRARTRRVLRLARRAALRALLVMWPPLATSGVRQAGGDLLGGGDAEARGAHARGRRRRG